MKKINKKPNDRTVQCCQLPLPHSSRTASLLTVITPSYNVTIPPILVPQNVIRLYVINSSAVGMAQSAWQLAAACSVMGSNPGKGDIFCTRPDCPRTPARVVHGVFRGERAAGSWR